ncbi:hypothetical protein TYRP_015442 [Tyrophagus putrescentiae]|nr:hypothetical protein TYRP_015442 [Tyrophagus putrescentiae]
MYLREYMRQYRSSYYQQHVLPARMAARAALVADSNNNGNSNNSNGNSIAASSGNSSGSDSGPENRTTDSSTIRPSSIMEVSDSSASTSTSSAWSSFSSSKAVKATSSSSFSSSSDSSDSADSSHTCGLEGVILSSSQTSSIRMTPPHTCTHKAEFAFPSSGRPQPRKPTMMPSFPSRPSGTSRRLGLLTPFAPGSSSSSDVGKSRDVRRQELLTSLETAFNSLAEVESGVADLAPTKLLLKTVVQARMCLETFDPSGRDVKLTFEVFNLALHKLSPGLRAQFLSIYCPSSPHCLTPGASLQSMVSFLQAEIVTQHAKSVWLITRNREENGDGIPLTPVDPLTTTPYCRYCKTTGHLYEHCLNVRQLLCFQCYEEGHTKRNCPYRVPVYRF